MECLYLNIIFKYASHAIICSSICITTTAVAEGRTLAIFDSNLVGRLSLGYGSFSFPERLDHTLVLPIYQASIGARLQRFYAVMNAANKLSREDVSNLSAIGSGSRYDYDLAAGAYLFEQDGWNLSWHIGYKWGRADIRYVDRVNPKHTYDDFYRNEGKFTGLNLSFKLPQGTRLALSAGLADLDPSNNFGQRVPDAITEEGTHNEIPDDVAEIKDSDALIDQVGATSGNSKGVSYGIHLKIPISSNVSFSSSLKVNDYRQDIYINGFQYKNLVDRNVQFTNGISVYFF